MAIIPVPATHEPGLGPPPEGGDIRVVEDLDWLACLGPDRHCEEHLPLQLSPLFASFCLHAQPRFAHLHKPHSPADSTSPRLEGAQLLCCALLQYHSCVLSMQNQSNHMGMKLNARLDHGCNSHVTAHQAGQNHKLACRGLKAVSVTKIGF